METKLEAERQGETTGMQARNDSGLDQIGSSGPGKTYLDSGYLLKLEPDFFVGCMWRMEEKR